jgi:hypothetical protein
MGTHPTMKLLTTEQLGYRKKQSTFYDYQNGWIEDSKEDFIYTGGNLPSGTLIYPFDSATQTTNLQYREFYQYDKDGNVLSHRLEQFNGSAWQLSEVDSEAFDSQGHSILEAGFGWDSVQNALIPIGGYRSTYTYNAKGIATSLLIEKVDSTHNWVKWLKYLSTFDSDGNMNGRKAYYWDGVTWLLEWRGIDARFLNNDGDKPLQETTQLYENGKYFNLEMSTMTYDAKERPASQFFKNYVNGAWQDSVKATELYDPNDILLSYYQLKWNGTSWDTIGGEKNDVTYDANNSPVLRIMSDFDPDLKQWTYTQKEVSEFESYETGIHSDYGSGNLQLYPNPANNELFINAGGLNAPEASIRIVDINGQVLYSAVMNLSAGKALQPIDVSSLKQGVYFVQIQANGNSYVRKFLK